jgi:hypothetical protein
MPSNRNLADLGASIDSGIAGEFLTVGDSGGLFRNPTWTEIASKPTTLDSAVAIALIDSAYIQARQTDVGLDSALTTSLVDSAYIQARSSVTGLDSAGAINLIDSAYLAARVSGGLDSAGVTGIVDSAYVSARASVNSGFGTYTYFATDGQTDFSGSDVDGNVLAYTADGIIVWYNGVQMLDTDDYTATNGTSVSLTRGADSGSSLVIGKWALGSSSSASSGLAWGGDRGIIGAGSNSITEISYFDITTEGNTSDFGDVTAARSNLGGTSNSTRGVFMGGYTSGGPAARNIMDYITISTPGNATDFGDTTVAAYYGSVGVVSDGTYGLWHIGYSGGTSTAIDYITIATTGNASDFGDRTESAYGTGSLCDATYGVFAGGDSYSVTIDYVTIATPGNASDFGDLTVGRKEFAGASDSTRGLFLGGQSAGPSYPSVVDYITTATTGNATDFGDFTTAEYTSKGSASSNGTRAVYGAAMWSVSGTPTLTDNRQEYFTIQTTGNATDFGDVSTMRAEAAGLSGAAA